MTTTPLPSRSQLNDAMEFFASFAGSAYKDDGAVELETPARARVLGDRTLIQIPESAVQGYIETWLRANWEEMVDRMVDSNLALEDKSIEDAQCPKVTAHGGHYWDASLFPDHFGPSSEALQEFHCDGIRVHPNCMIGRGHSVDA